MTNSLVGDHKVTDVDINEGVLEGSDVSGTYQNEFFFRKIRHKTCIIC